jgi:hypothetical protein
MADGSQRSATIDAPTPNRSWSILDGAWWLTLVAGLLLRELLVRLLPAGRSEFALYATTVSLPTFLVLAAYWRWRLRSPWVRAISLGIAVAAIEFGVGWLKGWL